MMGERRNKIQTSKENIQDIKNTYIERCDLVSQHILLNVLKMALV